MINKVEVALSSVHSLLYPRNVALVSCIDKMGKVNMITVAWCTPTSFHPPMVAISIGHQRYSHKLIKETKEFVVNIPTMDIIKDVLLCGRLTGKNFNKLGKTRLTCLPSKRVKAPIIKECVSHLECKVIQHMTTGDHTLFIGEVLAAHANCELFNEDFSPSKVKPIFQIDESEFATISSEIVKM